MDPEYLQPGLRGAVRETAVALGNSWAVTNLEEGVYSARSSVHASVTKTAESLLSTAVVCMGRAKQGVARYLCGRRLLRVVYDIFDAFVPP